MLTRFNFLRTATSGPSTVARALKPVILLSTLAVGVALLLAFPPVPARASVSGASAPRITLSVNPDSVTESSRSTEVTVTATAGRAVASDVTVTVSVGKSTDTATEGTDYTRVDDIRITIKSRETSGKGNFTLDGLEDMVAEGSETIRITGVAPGFSTVNTQIKIIDNDIVLSIDTDTNATGDQNEIYEESSTSTVRVIARFPGSSTLSTNTVVSITIGKNDDSATKGLTGDYTVTSPTSVANYRITIPAGRSEGSTDFTFSVINDADHEKEESITISANVAGFDIEDASFNIRDNDLGITLFPKSVYEIGVPEIDEDMEIEVEASLPYGMAPAEGIDIIISVGKSGDSAVSGTDFSAVNDFTLTIPYRKSSATKDFTFSAIEDEISDSAEKVTIQGKFKASDTINSAKYNILETSFELIDVVEEPRFSLSVFPTNRVNYGFNYRDGLSITENNSDRIWLTIGVPASSSLFPGGITPFGGLALSYGGSARHGLPVDRSLQSSVSEESVIDFRALNPTLLQSQTRFTHTYEMFLVDDNIAEGSEDLFVLGVANGRYYRSSSVSIVDNDVAPNTINLTVDTDTSTDGNQTEVSESTSSHTISVMAAFPDNSVVLPDPVSLTISVSGNGGSGEAESDDFEATDLTLIIPAGSTSGSGYFTLSDTDDNVAGEGREKVSVTATNADTSDTTFTVINGSEFYITDTDQKPTEISLSVDTDGNTSGAQTSVTEGAAATSVKVTASLPDGPIRLASATTVKVSVMGTSGSDGAESADFTAVTSFDVVIPAGDREGSATFTLTTVQDNFAEGPEKITVSGVLAGFMIADKSITINDDDPFPTISLSVDADDMTTGTQTSVGEGSAAKMAQVIASLPNNSKTFESKTEVTVTVMGKGGAGGAEMVDFVRVDKFKITIDAEQRSGSGTFSLDPTEDDFAEGDEKITISGEADRTGVSVNSTSVTITDNDTAPTVVLSVDLDTETTGDQKNIQEGDAAATVKVTASLPTGTGSKTFESETAITVTVVGEGGLGKAEPSDFTTGDIEKISIPGGGDKGSTTFTLTITDDSVADSVSETITVSGVADRTLTVNGVSKSITVTGDSIVIDMDNDIPPTKIDLSVDTDTSTVALDSSITEGPNRTIKVIATFSDSTATLENSTEVSLMVGHEDDSATSKTDYKEIDPAPKVTIEAGASNGSVTFTLEDTVDLLAGEGMETVSVSGTSTGFIVNGSSFTITDGDTPPTAIKLSVDTGNTVNPSTVAEDSGETEVMVKASFPAGSAVLTTNTTVEVTVAGGTATIGTADSLNDFTVETDKRDNKFDIVISAGSRDGGGSFKITVVNDRIYEPTGTSVLGETVTLSASPLTGFSFTNATVFIVDNEVADLDPSDCNGTYVDSTKTLLVADCEALVDIRNAWSPNLEPDHPLRTWGNVDNRDIDRWSGITIGSQQITKLLLPGNSVNGLIGGSLPTAIGDLSKLVEIDLSGNNLSNNMSVNIPNQIGQLTALEKLDLSDNNLSGSPPSRWWGSLTKLKTLDLSGNEFSGTIPSRLRSISTLTDLDLSDNKFSGSIPGSLDRLTALKTLDISNNEITGTIPRRLGNLAGSGLTKFSFCGNYLRGSLPTAFRTGVDTPGIASSDYSNIAVCRISTP